MTAKFIHTADWQLGKPFARIEDPQKRAILQQERLNVLARIAEAARTHGAQFVVVAGDLFDSPSATKATVSAACAAVGAMQLPVFAIPGNHDHGGPGSLWEQRFFQQEQMQLAPNLRVLLTPEPVELDAAILFPCPLVRRHESVDTTAWLRTIECSSSKPRIVIAHGSVQGFGAQEDEDETGGTSVNQIDLTRLDAEAFDYIALGDWHGMKQVAPKAWYAGTPELDRFPRGEANEPGHVLAVTAARSAEPIVTPMRTARLGWHQLAFEFDDGHSLDSLDEMLAALIGTRAQQDLLRLALCGTLGIEATTRLDQKLDAWQARLLRLKLSNQTVVAPSPAEIEALTLRTSDPLIGRVAAQLFEKSTTSEEDAAISGIALRELHALCRPA